MMRKVTNRRLLLAACPVPLARLTVTYVLLL